MDFALRCRVLPQQDIESLGLCQRGFWRVAVCAHVDATAVVADAGDFRFKRIVTIWVASVDSRGFHSFGISNQHTIEHIARMGARVDVERGAGAAHFIRQVPVLRAGALVGHEVVEVVRRRGQQRGTTGSDLNAANLR